MMCFKFLSLGWPTREREVSPREEDSSENDIPHPPFNSDLPIEVAGHVSRDAAGRGIQQDGTELMAP